MTGNRLCSCLLDVASYQLNVVSRGTDRHLTAAVLLGGVV